MRKEILLVLLLIIPLSVFGIGRELEVNFSTDFHQILEMESTHLVESFHNKNAIELSDTRIITDTKADLILEFDSQALMNNSYDYRVLEMNGAIVDTARFGSGAAYFRSQAGGLQLLVGEDGMFSPGNFVDDFSIEFWLLPAQSTEGLEILDWVGSSWLGNRAFSQGISFHTEQGVMVLNFKNFFVAVDEEQGALEGLQLEMKGRYPLIPREWSHHLIRYDAEEGLIEYLVNGIPEALSYVTDNGRSDGNKYQAYVGELSQNHIYLAEQYEGIIDEFQISKSVVEEIQLDQYNNLGGSAIIGPIDLEYFGSVVKSFSFQGYTPGQTDLRASILVSDRLGMMQSHQDSWIRLPQDLTGSELAEWTEITLDQEIRGRFLYIKVDLLPDGTGLNSPGIMGIKVNYIPDPPSPAPAEISARALDGAVQLDWSPVYRGDVEGYLIYFGEKPGQYWSSSENGLESPIDVGNATSFVLDGLIPDRLYYFKIASYNYSNNPNRGMHLNRMFSQEVSARPTR
jgi:hypothetical protein